MGHQPDEPIALCHRDPGDDTWREEVIALADADAKHKEHVKAGRDIWHSVNTPGQPIGSDKRGKANTYKRLVAVIADLDHATLGKPGGFTDIQTCEGVIAEVSNLIGQLPTVVVFSGHGEQPYWPLEATEAAQQTLEKAMALSRAFGALVAVVAHKQQPGVKVDNVSDLTRAGRSPLAINHKYPDHPVPTTAEARGGAPIGVQELTDRLAELGIDVDDYLTPPGQETISPPEQWVWNQYIECRWTPAMIAGWATDTPTARNPWMFNKKIKIEAAHRYGCFPDEQTKLDAHAALDRRFRQLIAGSRPEKRYEISGAKNRAVEKVAGFTDQKVAEEMGEHTHIDKSDFFTDYIIEAPTMNSNGQAAEEPGPRGFNDVRHLEQDFWERPTLNTIHTAALARMCSPWGVLGNVAAGALTLVPPTWTLPPLVGGPGSLNSFYAIVDGSGGGKNASASVAKELIGQRGIVYRNIGSGEGLVKAYFPKGTKAAPASPHTAILFKVAEIGMLGALGNRNGSTIQDTLKEAFSGGTLGFSYATDGKAEHLHEGTYRLNMVVGVQPKKAGILLDDEAGGTPQRFLWFPANDVRITADPPAWPGVLDIPRPHQYGQEITIPDEATRLIRSERAKNGRGEQHALDSHSLFCREKFAFALAVIDGRDAVSLDDWRLSGIASDVSAYMRGLVVEELHKGEREQAEKRGILQGVTRAAADSEKRMVEDDNVAAALNKVLEILTGGPMKRRDIREKLAKKLRVDLTEALKVGVGIQQIILHDDGTYERTVK